MYIQIQRRRLNRVGRGLETSKSFMRFCKAQTLASTSCHTTHLDILGNSEFRNPLQCPSGPTCPFRSRTSKAAALREDVCTPLIQIQFERHSQPGSRNSDLVLFWDYHLDARPGQVRARPRHARLVQFLQICSSGLVFSPIIHSILG